MTEAGVETEPGPQALNLIAVPGASGRCLQEVTPTGSRDAYPGVRSVSHE